MTLGRHARVGFLQLRLLFARQSVRRVRTLRPVFGLLRVLPLLPLSMALRMPLLRTLLGSLLGTPRLGLGVRLLRA